jgi:DUF1365 family protein
MTPDPTTSGLYTGLVTHTRLTPFRHHFRYRVFSLVLDVDEIGALARRLRLLSHNAPGLLSFHDRDHGDGSGMPVRQWVDAQLAAAGYETGGRIRLLCFPRLLGFVFNPLAMYFCEDRAGRLMAILHQVSNTFGERHSYLLPVAPGDGLVSQTCGKGFHVSPFFPVEGGYRFRIAPPAERFAVHIRYAGSDGGDRMVASHIASRTELTDGAVLRAVLRHPLMTLKVVAGIHWEALKLWWRGATFHRKPAPPLAPVTAAAHLSSQQPELVGQQAS